MSKQDLINGKYYVGTYINGNYIFKCNSELLSSYIKIENNFFNKPDGEFSRCHYYRKATIQEEAQLIASIKANKFIPLNEINIKQQFKTYI